MTVTVDFPDDEPRRARQREPKREPQLLDADKGIFTDAANAIEANGLWQGPGGVNPRRPACCCVIVALARAAKRSEDRSYLAAYAALNEAVKVLTKRPVANVVLWNDTTPQKVVVFVLRELAQTGQMH